MTKVTTPGPKVTRVTTPKSKVDQRSIPMVSEMCPAITNHQWADAEFFRSDFRMLTEKKKH